VHTSHDISTFIRYKGYKNHTHTHAHTHTYILLAFFDPESKRAKSEKEMEIVKERMSHEVNDSSWQSAAVEASIMKA